MDNADAVISAIGGSGDASTYKAVDNEVQIQLHPSHHASLIWNLRRTANCLLCEYEFWRLAADPNEGYPCMQKDAVYPVQGNVALVDAALKKNIRKFVLMSSLLTNGKEAGQSLNPGTIFHKPFPVVAKSVRYCECEPGSNDNVQLSAVVRM